MDTSGFIKYDIILKLLDENDYFGFKVGRIGKRGTRLRYTFASVKWYTIDIEVEVLKLEGERIVTGIKFDNEEVNGLDNFRRRIGDVSKIHAQRRKQNVR